MSENEKEAIEICDRRKSFFPGGGVLKDSPMAERDAEQATSYRSPFSSLPL